MNTLGTLRSSTGLGTGLDLQGMTSQLADAEVAEKRELLQKEEVSTLAKITGFGQIKSSLTQLQDSLQNLKDTNIFAEKTSKIINDSTVSVDINYFTAEVASNAPVGNFKIEIRQLAQAHKLGSAEFSSESYVLGSGVLRIVVGYGQQNNSTHDIVISEDADTLAGIRDAINAKRTSTGVYAFIVSADSGSRLLLSAEKPGNRTTLHVSVTEDNDNLSALAQDNLTVYTVPQDAIVRLDEVASDITVSDNKITDLLPGVNLKLYKAEVNKVHQLIISNDSTKTKTSIKNFVEKYNDFIDIKNELTRVSTVDSSKNGDLLNNPTIRNLDFMMRRTLATNAPQVEYSTLMSIGISSNIQEGKLSLDELKLNSALDKNIDAVNEFFTNSTYGIALQLYGSLNTYNSGAGLLQQQINQLNESVKKITLDKLKLEQKKTAREVELTHQYARLDASLGRLNATADTIARDLSKNAVAPLSFRKK